MVAVDSFFWFADNSIMEIPSTSIVDQERADIEAVMDALEAIR